MNFIGVAAPGSTRRQLFFYSKDIISTDYVSIEEDRKRYIFEVAGIETINERLKDAEFFRIMRVEDDYSKYNIFKTEAYFIGALKDREIINDFFYIAPPGTKIYNAQKEDIENIFDITQGVDRINIGNFLKYDSISVHLNFDMLFSTHSSILGRTGSGKTYFIKNLLKILRTKYIAISPTDEYNSLTENVNLFDSGRIPVAINFSECKNAFDLNDSEMQYLKDYFKSKEIDETISSVELAEIIYSFYQKLNINSNYQNLFIFAEKTNPKIELPRFVSTLCEKLSRINILISFVRKKLISKFPIVFSTQELSEKEESIAVHSLLSSILHSRINKYKGSYEKPENMLIVLEEAHNYAPSTKTTKCKDIIVQIARVGRKYGLHLLVLSQRPRYIDQTLLSQCGTNFIFNLPNPQDIEYVMEHSYFYNEKSRNTIQNLKTGECLITSNARNSDIICKISL
jgi:DNA helicase HerA-like ATPase